MVIEVARRAIAFEQRLDGRRRHEEGIGTRRAFDLQPVAGEQRSELPAGETPPGVGDAVVRTPQALHAGLPEAQQAAGPEHRAPSRPPRPAVTRSTGDTAPSRTAPHRTRRRRTAARRASDATTALVGVAFAVQRERERLEVGRDQPPPRGQPCSGRARAAPTSRKRPPGVSAGQQLLQVRARRPVPPVGVLHLGHATVFSEFHPVRPVGANAEIASWRPSTATAGIPVRAPRPAHARSPAQRPRPAHAC